MGSLFTETKTAIVHPDLQSSGNSLNRLTTIPTSSTPTVAIAIIIIRLYGIPLTQIIDFDLPLLMP